MVVAILRAVVKDLAVTGRDGTRNLVIAAKNDMRELLVIQLYSSSVYPSTCCSLAGRPCHRRACAVEHCQPQALRTAPEQNVQSAHEDV